MSKQKLSPEAQAIISAFDAEQYATTIALVQKFLIDNPKSQRAWIDLGQSLAHLSRYEEAEKAFRKVVELAGESESGAIFGEIGNLYRDQADLVTAEKWYLKQIETDSNDATGLLYLGNLQLRQGKLAAAKETFERALTCELVCLEETHFALGVVHRGIGDFVAAREHFQKAIEYDGKFDAAKIALKDVNAAQNLKTAGS